MARQSDSVDRALWTALRAQEEQGALSGQVAERSGDRRNDLSAQRYLKRAQEATRSASLLRRLLQRPMVDRTDPGAEHGKEDGV